MNKRIIWIKPIPCPALEPVNPKATNNKMTIAAETNFFILLVEIENKKYARGRLIII